MKKRIGDYFGNRCSDCGVENPHISFFDLHHIDPTLKEVKNSRLLSWAWERVLDELKNCVFLCPSCHRMRHIETGDYSDMDFYNEVVDEPADVN